LYKNYRIGLIVPSPNVVIEPEFYSLGLENIGFYTSRVLLGDCLPEELKRMGEYAKDSALKLSTAEVDIILYACTSGSFIEGGEWLRNLKNDINKIGKASVITTSEAVIEALFYMNISKVVVITPYTQEVNDKEKIFLEASGIKVLQIKGLNIIKSVKIADVEPEEIFKEAVEINKKNPDSQGIFISCTNLRTFTIINKLEKYLMKPVITSNQASLWALINRCNLDISINKLGQLFNKK